MKTTRLHLLVLPLALIIGAASLSACSPDPQEQYDDAVEQLKQAREARDDAQDKLDDKKQELKELQANLNEAEANLADARKKVDQAAQKVDKTVNDEVLFRTLQRELLDDKKFKDAAISVGVQDRVVTLSGNVPDEKTRKKALQTARDQAGVKNVIDSLRVADGAQSAPPEPKQDQPAPNAPASPSSEDSAADSSAAPDNTQAPKRQPPEASHPEGDSDDGARMSATPQSGES